MWRGKKGRLMKVISRHIGAPLDRKFRERCRGGSGEYDEYDYRCESVCGSNEFRVWGRKGI